MLCQSYCLICCRRSLQCPVRLVDAGSPIVQHLASENGYQEKDWRLCYIRYCSFVSDPPPPLNVKLQTR